MCAYKVEIIHSWQDLGSCRAICPGSSPGARTKAFGDLERHESLSQKARKPSQSRIPGLSAIRRGLLAPASNDGSIVT